MTQDPGFKAQDLLLDARGILACPNPDCVTSCTRCLNDYSNQRLWPEFERKPALAWIEAILLDAGVAHHAAVGGVSGSGGTRRG